MTDGIHIVEPAGSRTENRFVLGVVLVIASAGGIAFALSDRIEPQEQLFDWQISAFYDLNAPDQAIYNALVPASEELWWLHGDLLYFGSEAQRENPWPTAEELDVDYAMPPFVKDVFWTQHGRVNWERVASFSFEGSAVYFGSGGAAERQSAYLLMLSHVHKGASYTDGATIWVHEDANVAAPKTIKRDSLIVNGWREVVPYSGAMEVQRLRGG